MCEMIIDAVSDLHGYLPLLTGGDLLIIAGDITAHDDLKEWATFFSWLKKQDYKKKILVAGNHDNFLEVGFPKSTEESDSLKEVQSYLEEIGEFTEDDRECYEYLCDSGTEFEGLNIWGSPWSNWFHGVHPKCAAFMPRRSKIQRKFEKIPGDVDILITHSPPFGILDENNKRESCGSIYLTQMLDKRIKPKLHFFGHIHEQHGKELVFKRPGTGTENNTRCFNVSYVDEKYKPTNEVRRIVLCA